MNKFILGKFQDNDSFINKMDARVKIFIMIFLLVLTLLPFKLFRFVFLFLFLLILFAFAKIKLTSIFKIIKPMIFMFVILLIINVFAIKEGMVLFRVGDFLLYDQAIYQTVFIVFRIIMILMISTLLTSSTNPTDLTYAIEFYLKPLKLFKINIHEIAITISIAIRFIPTLVEEAQIIMKAQTSRGIDFEYGKVKDKLLAVTSLIIPLFIICFDKADDLSNAMITRGYNSTAPRSKYKRLKTTKYDLIGLVVFSLFVTAFILLGVFL